jgi:hypothetical protein
MTEQSSITAGTKFEPKKSILFQNDTATEQIARLPAR